MKVAEIVAMIKEGVVVKVAIFNNGYLGMVRQWQQFFHGGRYASTPIWSPDYVKLAAAYGIPGWRIKSAGEIQDALRRAKQTPRPPPAELGIEKEANALSMCVPRRLPLGPLGSAPGWNRPAP